MIGIYKIENSINGKLYIGQSWNITKRLWEHKKNEQSILLKRAYQKHGLENFKFNVIREVFKSKFEDFTQSLLDGYEKFYIKKYDTLNRQKGYNIREGGNSSLLSKETKQKISNTKKGRPSTWKGKSPSIESRAKMREAKIGKKEN